MDVNQEKNVSKAIKYGRSVRKYKTNVLDEQKVTECIHLATLAATSSNM